MLSPMTEAELSEMSVDAITKLIGDGLREHLNNLPPLTIESVRETIMKTMYGVTSVEVDPEDPTRVIITYEPPRRLELTCVLDLSELE